MPRVTEGELRAYLERFLHVYTETATMLPDEIRRGLVRLSLLPARIEGIISQTYGVAVRYTPTSQNAESSIDVWTGFRSVELLVFHPPSRLLRRGRGISLNASNATLQRSGFEDCIPIRMQGATSSATLIDITCRSGDWSAYIHLAEMYGNAEAEFWDREKATERAKDEILAAALDAQLAFRRQVSMDEYIRQYKEKQVLVLGSYSAEGKPRLRRIAEQLAKDGYEPIMLKDIPDHPEMSLRAKAVAVATVSRFVVVEDSEPAGHLVEVADIPTDSIRVIVRLQGQQSTYLTLGMQLNDRNVTELGYSTDSLEQALKEGVIWAEERVSELRQGYAKLYPWRSSTSPAKDSE